MGFWQATHHRAPANNARKVVAADGTADGWLALITLANDDPVRVSARLVELRALLFVVVIFVSKFFFFFPRGDQCGLTSRLSVSLKRGGREGGLFYATAASFTIFVLLCFVGSGTLEGGVTCQPYPWSEVEFVSRCRTKCSVFACCLPNSLRRSLPLSADFVEVLPGQLSVDFNLSFSR